MKNIISLVIGFSLLSGICFADTMDAVHYNAYLFAKGQTNWAWAEALTAFPDVKAWDEWHIGMEYIAVLKHGLYYYKKNASMEDKSQAFGHFEIASGYADDADKEGRSGKGKSSTKNLRKMILHGMNYIKSN